MDKYECTICGYIYDEAEGDADNGIAAGTKFAESSGRLGMSDLRC